MESRGINSVNPGNPVWHLKTWDP